MLRRLLFYNLALLFITVIRGAGLTAGLPFGREKFFNRKINGLKGIAGI